MKKIVLAIAVILICTQIIKADYDFQKNDEKTESGYTISTQIEPVDSIE